MAKGETDSCMRALMASAEVVSEECDGQEMVVRNVDGNALALLPKDAADEFGMDIDEPETERELAEAIESCMGSEWATDWATSVLSPDASQSALEQAKRSACEGLFS